MCLLGILRPFPEELCNFKNRLFGPNVRDPLAPRPPSLARPRTIHESILFTPLNLPDPKFNRVEQTLYYGVEPLLYLPESIDWASLLTRLNRQTWTANQFQLDRSGETATIVLAGQPLLQADAFVPVVSQTSAGRSIAL